ncbi:hypoxia inducible factor 1 subunit alpha, like isoform X2 [Centropristis striata]|uniref:hypoxia inducible factor 1 subunit alpha, like isoform X2 n=1 Tax=Centropristis striata TaxID=184440 RepID=UPI0027E05425|nr:hypoxia inducible factor 1 subunit alpha, like isoform X2 [Centropristis striata]
MKQKEETRPAPRSSLEQRKLRSRDAARCRRSQETEVFYELARTLPLPRRVYTHLDKSAIMRVALSFLRLHRFLRPAERLSEMSEEDEDPMDAFCPQALAGFIMVLTEDGDIIYLTEDVNRHVGIAQLELLGQSIYDFVHPCDQEELRELLSPRPAFSKKQLAEQPSQRNFFLRMKSTLTSRGRTVNIKSAAWKVFHCSGLLRPADGSAAPPSGRVMTLLCEPIPHPSSVEFPLDTCTLLTRHSMDLRFTHCEGRVTELVGYRPEDLIGRSAFQFHHALDSEHVSSSLHTLLSKGQVSTSQYRFLARHGGFVWVETQATVLYSSRLSQPEAVICLNFILSSVEQPDVVFSVEQTRCGRRPAAEDCGLSELSDSDSKPLSGCANTEADPAADAAADTADAPEAEDAVVPLAGDLVELSFSGPASVDSVPDHPEDMCSPQLRQLLSPIFSPLTPPPSSSSPSSSSSSADLKQDEDEEDSSSVLKFFSVCEQPEDTLEDEPMDLDMLAPYISMDDDFQLSVFSCSEEQNATLTEDTPPAAGRKRTHNGDKDKASQQTSQDKRRRQDPSSSEEELLLIHRLLGCLQDSDQSESLLDPGPGGWSQLLTDKDPVLGALMSPLDLSPPLSPIT